MVKWKWAAMLFGIAGAVAAASAAGVSRVDPLERSSMKVERAAGAVMLAVTPVGDRRVVAAGERGLVVVSDDHGKTWQQADVPVAVTLTALSFPTATEGWAVGHGGVVLRSTDAGRSWTKQLDGRAIAEIELQAARASGDERRLQLAQRLVSDGPDKPLLAVHFWDRRRGLAVGAYGIAVLTEDGGEHWQSWMGHIPNPRGLHLNALHAYDDRVMLAGEQGLLLRSVDRGDGFERIESPYKGSWFAVTGDDQRLVIAGLRGNVFVSPDGGRTWAASEVPVPVTINSVVSAGGGALYFSNQAGLLLASTDNGRSLHPVQRFAPTPANALAVSTDGHLMAATFSGVVRVIPLGSSVSSPASLRSK